jgi:hypothetical protein
MIPKPELSFKAETDEVRLCLMLKTAVILAEKPPIAPVQRALSTVSYLLSGKRRCDGRRLGNAKDAKAC